MTTEFVYSFGDGREEVRYRRPKDSPEALEMIEQVLELQRKHGDSCPYSFRHVEPDEVTSFWCGEKLFWRIGGEEVSDSELRSWCHQNMEYPQRIIGSCVLKMHTDAYAKRNA